MRQVTSTPLERGFLNHWHATIPLRGRVVDCSGVCTVQFANGLICRNKVFFDRLPLLSERRSDAGA